MLDDLIGQLHLSNGAVPWHQANPVVDDDEYENNNRLTTDWKDKWKYSTAPVGSFEPNGYGLYDMAGNVAEWCHDWYQHDYYKVSPMDNPKGPETGNTKVSRGGHWYS
ncbi:MAG: SUMF1/EgtB/PvdO family nonheme iron enzyme, partial [Chloroflexi bacterium]|nr:SUMF1/EgtB/PvdO family nonheme iron enzyme [Chloroflexota bacterium]